MTPREGCDPVNRLYYVDLQTLKDGISGKAVAALAQLFFAFTLQPVRILFRKYRKESQ